MTGAEVDVDRLVALARDMAETIHEEWSMREGRRYLERLEEIVGAAVTDNDLSATAATPKSAEAGPDGTRS